MMGAWSLAAFAVGAIAACGGKIDDRAIGDAVVTTPDAGSSDAVDASTVIPIGFDAGSFDTEGGAPFPPVANGPSDISPSCASRASFDCSCHGEDCPPGDQIALGDLVHKCLVNGDACGYIYVDFDPDGCATALLMDQPDPTFVACVTEALDSERWLCAESTSGHQTMAYVDCTTRGR